MLYSESCLSQTLNKLESCVIKQTLNKSPNVGNLCIPNTRTYKLVPMRFGLDSFHCICINIFFSIYANIGVYFLFSYVIGNVSNILYTNCAKIHKNIILFWKVLYFCCFVVVCCNRDIFFYFCCCFCQLHSSANK